MKILLMNPKIIYQSWPVPTATELWKYLSNGWGVTFPQLCATIPEYEY